MLCVVQASSIYISKMPFQWWVFSCFGEGLCFRKGRAWSWSLSSLPSHPWSLCPGWPYQTALPAGSQDPGSHREESHVVKDLKMLRHWSNRHYGPTPLLPVRPSSVSECPASSCSMGKAKESLPQALRGLVSPSRTQKYTSGWFLWVFPVLQESRVPCHESSVLKSVHFSCDSATSYPFASLLLLARKGCLVVKLPVFAFPKPGKSMQLCSQSQLSFEYLSSCPQLHYLCLVSRFLV